MNHVTRSLGLCLALAVLFSTLGCAFGEIYWDDPLKREYSLGESQKRYTELVRFGKFADASAFVDPVMTEEFVQSFPSHKNFAFTDYESGQIEFDDEGTRENATVRVEYSGYHSDSLVLMDFVENQHWYRDSVMNDWLVRSSFKDFERVTE
jgi:hypothetical protein